MQGHSPSGFEAIPTLQWGSHVSQFFETGDDLHNLLVPYFKAGLENGENCLWVTGAPFGANQARSALRNAVGDFDVREKRGQIEIRDAHEWYEAGAKLKPHEIVAGLVQRTEEALFNGYQGLRTHGNCSWVEPGQWEDFLLYETLVQKAMRGRRMICMCGYCRGEMRGDQILDVLERHDFVISRPGRALSLHEARIEPVPRAAGLDKGMAGLLEAIPAALYTTDAEGYLTYYNQAAARLWGYSPEIGKQQWCGCFRIFLFDGTPVPHDECPMAIVLKTGKAIHGVEAEAERPDGTRVPCAVYPTPLFGDDGNIAGAINLIVDISERKAIEDRTLTMAREMHHRVNNTLMTVQAVVRATMRHATTMEQFKRSLSARIEALSQTHALLTDRVQPSASLRHLLGNELGMYMDDEDSRIVLSGPDLMLPERVAVPVGMALHELATNAAKYGALSAPNGALSVQWTRVGGDISIYWRERNVPIVREITRTGFGTRLLTEILPRQLDAHIELRFESDGLAARLVIPG